MARRENPHRPACFATGSSTSAASPSPPEPGVTHDIDCVLLSHLHPDHLDPPSLRSLGRETPIFAPRRLERRAPPPRASGTSTELAPGDSSMVGSVRIRGLRGRARRAAVSPSGERFKRWGSSSRARANVLFAGDTAPFDMSALPSADVALLPIAGWGPNLRTEHHLDPRTAAEAAASPAPADGGADPLGHAACEQGSRAARTSCLTAPREEFAAPDGGRRP